MHNATIFDSIPLTPRKRVTVPSSTVDYATDENSNPIYASEYSKEDWTARGKTGLDCMLCIQEERDISAVGFVKHATTPHFRHRKATEHSYETQWHFESKMLLARILEPSGSQVEVEKSLNKGTSRADVYAETDSQGFAFEVQYSGQDLELYHTRTQKYLDSGKRCQWLYHPECDVINIGREIELGDLVLSDDKKQIGFIVFRDYSNAIWLPWIHRSEVEFKHVAYTDIDDWHLGENGLEPRPETKAHDTFQRLQKASWELRAEVERRRVAQAEEDARREREKEEKRLAWAERIQNQKRDEKERIQNAKSNKKPLINISGTILEGTQPESLDTQINSSVSKLGTEAGKYKAQMNISEWLVWGQRRQASMQLIGTRPLSRWLHEQEYQSSQHYEISMLFGFMYDPKNRISFLRGYALFITAGRVLDRERGTFESTLDHFFELSSIWQQVRQEPPLQFSGNKDHGFFWAKLKNETFESIEAKVINSDISSN